MEEFLPVLHTLNQACGMHLKLPSRRGSCKQGPMEFDSFCWKVLHVWTAPEAAFQVRNRDGVGVFSFQIAFIDNLVVFARLQGRQLHF